MEILGQCLKSVTAMEEIRGTDYGEPTGKSTHYWEYNRTQRITLTLQIVSNLKSHFQILTLSTLQN